MGGAIGALASGIGRGAIAVGEKAAEGAKAVGGKIGSALKPTFSSGDSEIEGTGHTAGELSDLGYSRGDLAKMGVKIGPSALQKGIGAGINQGLQNQQNRQAQINRGGMPAMFDTGGAPMVDPSYFQPPDYSRRFAPQPSDPYSGLFYAG